MDQIPHSLIILLVMFLSSGFLFFTFGFVNILRQWFGRE
jgi:hypothetical protein